MDQETTFLLGAGFNQLIEDWDGIRPPLAQNFFNNLLRSRIYNNEKFQIDSKPLFDFINQVWKKGKSALRDLPFNLESLFTYIELKFEESEMISDMESMRRYITLDYRFTSLLAQFLTEFHYFFVKSPVYLQLGRRIYDSKPNLITFNYDNILENLIETVSMPRNERPPEVYTNRESDELTEEIITYSHFNWNRPLFYGINFDQIQLHKAGLRKIINGKNFYKTPGNEISDWNILKLHGSLNWFRFLPIRSYPSQHGEDVKLSTNELKEILLLQNEWLGTFNLPELNGWFLKPVLITPVLYKSKFYNERPFKELWKKAKEDLEITKKLIVIGYSFSPTDFSVKKLFLDSFMSNDLKELIVVNPDTSVVKTVKELTHFNKPITVCRDLNEFITVY